MEPEPITIIDRKVLKALSADTRMDILKELAQGSRTPSDLGKMLGKKDSTIVEHLETLVKIGLVKKVEQPGKKWIYYTLTEKGESIITKQSTRLVIILSVSILAFLGSIVSFLKYMQRSSFSKAELSQDAAKEATSALGVAPATLAQAHPYVLYLSMILLAVTIAALFYYITQKRGK